MKKNSKIFKFKFYSLLFSIYIIFVGYANSVSEDFVYASSNLKNIKLIPSGQAVAMKLKTSGVLVVGVKKDAKYPAEKSGIKNGDIITMVNNTEILNTMHFQEIIKTVKDKEITLTIERETQKIKIKTHAIENENSDYVMGMWLRDSAAGIGTVSFYTSDKKHFYALGHPIADTDTNKNYSVRKGSLELVDIHGAKVGEKSNPGELIGTMSNYEIGTISKNDTAGIYGDIQNSGVILEQPCNICEKKDVHPGKAYILSTVSNCGVEKFEIEIARVLDNQEKKDFIIYVTDKRLLEKTGGIVQGMSGSPILQNDKIVGAVTHVLINDPKKGYGISVENMLK